MEAEPPSETYIFTIQHDFVSYKVIILWLNTNLTFFSPEICYHLSVARCPNPDKHNSNSVIEGNMLHRNAVTYTAEYKVSYFAGCYEALWWV